MPDDRRGDAQKQRRVVRNGVSALTGVFGIIQPQTDDLARTLDDRQEVDLNQLRQRRTPHRGLDRGGDNGARLCQEIDQAPRSSLGHERERALPVSRCKAG